MRDASRAARPPGVGMRRRRSRFSNGRNFPGNTWLFGAPLTPSKTGPGGGIRMADLPFSLTRPLIFFDLETTGLDFKYDRVIEIGALKITPDGRKEKFTKRINPG